MIIIELSVVELICLPKGITSNGSDPGWHHHIPHNCRPNCHNAATLPFINGWKLVIIKITYKANFDYHFEYSFGFRVLWLIILKLRTSKNSSDPSFAGTGSYNCQLPPHFPMMPPSITFDHQLFLTHSKKGKVAEFHFHSESAVKVIRSVNHEARIANSVFYLTVL